jgi:hypothetical protein
MYGRVHDRDTHAAIEPIYRGSHGTLPGTARQGGVHRTAFGAVQVRYAWGQPVRPGFALLSGQRWTNQEANLLSRKDAGTV